jgi:hypothetical protein
MADNKSEKLRERRAALSESLPALNRKREHTYRLSNDAQSLDRAGVTDRAPQELARLAEDQVEADATLRAAQHELRDVEAEITRPARRGAASASWPRLATRVSYGCVFTSRAAT